MIGGIRVIGTWLVFLLAVQAPLGMAPSEGPLTDVSLAGISPPDGAPSVRADGGQNGRVESPFRGPRDVLKALGISDSFWESLRDGVPIQPDERELLLRLIVHIKMFQPAELEEWKQEPPDWSTAASEAKALRGRLLEVEGHIVKVGEEPVPPEMAGRAGFSHYYCSELETEGGPRYLIYSRDLAQPWKGRKSLREKARVKGLFFKLAGTAPEFLPVLVTNRPEWYPDSLLGRLGMDCSLFNDVAMEATDQRYVSPTPQKSGELESEVDPLEKYRLTGRDRECFYQLLAAAARARPGELLDIAKQELAKLRQTTYSVVPLFNDAPRQQGKLFLLYGTARRIERVNVEDVDIRKRLGIDHYYTIYLFTDDSQNYPVVFCVRFLPNNVVPGEGPGYAVNLAVAGFFMKTWAFRPQASLSPDAPRHAWQLAPLLIGREAVLLAKPAAPQRVAEVTGILAGIVATLVGVIGVLVWWLNRRDRKRQRLVRERLTPHLDAPPSQGGASEDRSD